MSEKQPDEEKPVVADDPEPKPEQKPIPEIKPELRPEARPESEEKPKSDPVITEGAEETPKHKVTLTKPHKCPRCGENTEPCKIKTKEGVVNARVCGKCRIAFT